MFDGIKNHSFTTAIIAAKITDPMLIFYLVYSYSYFCLN